MRQPGLDPSEVELAAMRRRHLRQVLRIESQVYPRPWSAALFLQEILRDVSMQAAWGAIV